MLLQNGCFVVVCLHACLLFVFVAKNQGNAKRKRSLTNVCIGH